jgi:hypothetical protein
MASYFRIRSHLDFIWCVDPDSKECHSCLTFFVRSLLSLLPGFQHTVLVLKVLRRTVSISMTWQPNNQISYKGLVDQTKPVLMFFVQVYFG